MTKTRHGHGRQDQCANSQLGPLNLFAAWHGVSLDEAESDRSPHRLENSRKGRGYRALLAYERAYRAKTLSIKKVSFRPD